MNEFQEEELIRLLDRLSVIQPSPECDRVRLWPVPGGR